MKVVIIHGNGLTAILDKISQIRKDADRLSIVELSGKNTSFDQALLQTATPALFSEKRLVIFEEFDEKVVDLAKIPQDDDLTLVIKFNKPLTASSALLKQAQGKTHVQVLSFSENDEVSVFPFLDALADKNPKAMQDLEVQLTQRGSQYVITMIFFMLRRFILIPKKLPPFVVKKLETQRKKLGDEKISKMYRTVIETDFKIKNGILEESVGLTLLVDKLLKTF